MTSSSDSILITSYDLKRLAFRLVPHLKRIAIVLFCLTFFFLIFKQPEYLAKASFKHLDKQNDYSPFAKEIFKELSFSSQSAAIYSVMHSNRVLKSTIEELGMHVIADSSFHPVRRALENLKSEWGRKPKDLDLFCFRYVSFEEEKPFRFYVRALTLKTFEILNPFKQVIGLGELGQSVILPECTFTLTAFPQSIQLKKIYGFTIIPWLISADQVRKAFEIRSHKLDKNVFTLYFKHADRKLAAQFLNQVMHWYQEYYRKENEEICETQVAYLEKRQDELIRQFDSALKEHVTYLKNNVTESGCIGFSNELDILATPQDLFNSKLFDVDLELKRLESLYTEPSFATDDLQSEKHMRHPTDVQLSIHRENLQATITAHELDHKRLSLSHDALNSESPLTPLTTSLSSCHDITYPFNDPEMLDCDALTLQSAKALYLQYTEKKDLSEAQLRERTFLRERLNDPDFEISSLSTFLPDPVTVSLAQHASDIALKIKDPENRTTREQERLKEELDTQKRFLHQHLTHMIELEKLQLTLLSHKIHSLQLQTRNLLDAEKHLLQEKIAELNQKMSTLPEKWHRENLLLLKKELGSRIIGSMTQLVETKNLNQKLYQVSSKHLDLAVPPLKPLPPHLITYSLAIAFLGCFAYYTYRLCKLFLTGFPVSHANLKYLGFSSFGILSPFTAKPFHQLQSTDVTTLKSLVHFITSLPAHSLVIVLNGKNPDFSAHVAQLLSFADKKILLTHYLCQDTAGTHVTSDGQEGQIDHLICHLAHYDAMTVRNADQLAHPALWKRTDALKQQYDTILLQSNAQINSIEARLLIQNADAVVVAVQDESQEDLFSYRAWAEKSQNTRLAIVCFD